MAIELKMPALSPTMEEGKLAKWLVKEGDNVQSGDILAEIETDKATMEFEAVDEGTIGKLVVPEGTENVKVGTVIALIDGEPKASEAQGEAPSPATEPKAEQAEAPAKEEKAAEADVYQRVQEGHWRKTDSSGTVTDIHSEFHELAFDLTDFVLVDSADMEVGSVEYTDDDPYLLDWVKQSRGLQGPSIELADLDSYTEGTWALARGHLDGTAIGRVDRGRYGPWYSHEFRVLLRFERAWDDAREKKWVKGVGQTDEDLSLGEAQYGHLSLFSHPDTPNAEINLDLRVPGNFLPRVREAFMHPSRIGRIQLRAKVKLFGEPYDSILLLDPDDDRHLAYFTYLSFSTRPLLPSPPDPKNAMAADFRPAALRMLDPVKPGNWNSGDIAAAMKMCAFAIAALAVILLVKLG